MVYGTYAMHYIYLIQNSINTKVYVGQTLNVAKRKAGHLYSARRGDHRVLYCDMRELGIENFNFSVLEECTDANIACQREAYWITHYNSFNNGYNLTHTGSFHVGNRGRKFSEEHKRKISESHKGKTLSFETKKKLAMANKGKKRGPHSDKTKQKMSIAQRGKIISDETREKIRKTLQGRTLSLEHKQKISAARTGFKHSSVSIEKMKTHVFTEEHCFKLSKVAKAREHNKRITREKQKTFIDTTE